MGGIIRGLGWAGNKVIDFLGGGGGEAAHGAGIAIPAGTAWGSVGSSAASGTASGAAATAGVSGAGASFGGGIVGGVAIQVGVYGLMWYSLSDADDYLIEGPKEGMNDPLYREAWCAAVAGQCIIKAGLSLDNVAQCGMCAKRCLETNNWPQSAGGRSCNYYEWGD